jgi:hypothetical protein
MNISSHINTTYRDVTNSWVLCESSEKYENRKFLLKEAKNTATYYGI